MIGYGNSYFISTILDSGAAPVLPPSNTVAPVISGTQVVGSSLSSTTGTWTGTAPITYTYQWYRGATLISGATSSSYTLVQADAGNASNITCQVTATNGGGSATATSNTLAQIFDFDANAFITAASITDNTQKSATNSLTIDLKGYGVWTKMKALYPMVGGTASQHKWNLKDPRDLDAAFRLTYGGSVTHSANGVTGGINGFCDTKFNDSTNFTSNTNGSFSVYTRNNFVNDLNFYTLIGCSTDNHVSGMTIRGTIYNEYLGLRDAIGSRVIGVISNRLAGQYLLTKDGTNRRYFKNSSKINTTANGTSNPANRSLYLLADNYSGGTGYYAQHTIAFAHIGDNLDDTEAANFYTAVQAFQTTLGRSIGTQTVSDADAQAFVTAADIQDQVEANAINNLVIGLKADSLWTKMKAVYPMVGGTSTSTSYNLKNTAQYQISWSGGVTWEANGVQFGGVNGYGNTGLNQSSVLSQNSQHISFYSRTNTDANLVDIGLKSSGSAYTMLQTKYSNTFTASLNEFYNFADHSANTNSQGFYVGNRTGATVRNNWKNGSKVHTSSSASQTQANFNFFIGAYNNAGTAANYTNRQCAFASIGDGLDDTEATNLNNRVTTFQTALNRNV